MLVEERHDVLRWCIYDTFKATANTELLFNERTILFKTPYTVWSKTKIDTNMVLSAMLPQPQHLNITHSQIAYGAMNDDNDNKMFKDKTRYEFVHGHKIYDEGPINRYHTLSTNIDYQSFLETLEAAKLQDAKVIGNYIDYRIGNGPIGHHVLQGEQLYVNLIFDPMKFRANFKMTYFLEGVIVRGVQ